MRRALVAFMEEKEWQEAAFEMLRYVLDLNQEQ